VKRVEQIGTAQTATESGVRVVRVDGQVVVEWPGIGRLVASPSAEPARFVPSASLAPDLLRKFRATDLLACQRYLSGRISLHGSSVSFASDCVALVGQSGSGKSTTAMELVERAGASFVADDIVPVDWELGTAIVNPVDDTFWLSEDSRRLFDSELVELGKRACSPRSRATQPGRLRAIIELGFEPGSTRVGLHQLEGQDAFLAVSHAHVCFRSGGDDEDTYNFESRARLCRAVPIFRLVRPHSLDRIC